MPTLIEMLEAGVHFGHKKERSHPKAKEFIFTIREGVYVIDLEKTRDYLKKAITFLKQKISEGKTILFVGTKKQAKELIKKGATDLGMPYVDHRWLGGTLTNFETVRRSITEMERLESQLNSPEFKSLTKKEQKIITEKLNRLKLSFEGVKTMKNLPDVIFVLDTAREDIVVAEANRMEIPIVGITDTDANPEKITYPIPANDDAPKSLEMILSEVFNAVKEGQGFKGKEAKQEKTKEEIKEEPKAEAKAEKPEMKEKAVKKDRK